MKCYLAHPIADYGTERQRRAVAAIEAQGWTVENPDQPVHQDAYRQHGMAHFVEVVKSCSALAFVRFPGGMIGAGVAREIEAALTAGLRVYDVTAGTLEYSGLMMPCPVLTVEQTRELLAALRSVIPTAAQTRRDLTEDQIMSVLRRTVQGKLLGLLTIKGLIPSMAAECLAREFIAASQPSPAATVEDMVPRSEMVEALADQRRRMGAEYDELDAELMGVRKVAKAEIERLQRSSAGSEAANWARLSASEYACYRWPEDTAEHRAMRAAFMDGAAHAVTRTEPQEVGMREALEKIVKATSGERHTVNEQNAFEHFGRLNLVMVMVREIAENTLAVTRPHQP